MTHLAYIDTETSGLDIERHAIWELALIVEGHKTSWFNGEHVWQFPIDLMEAEPIALSIGGWYERSAQWSVAPRGPAHNLAWKERGVHLNGQPFVISNPDFDGRTDLLHTLKTVADMLRGAHLVGANPAFDAYRLERMLRQHDMLSTWHYHLVDIETLMLGWLARSNTGSGDMPTIPWKSDDLSKRIGVETPSGEERHTALGDARWAKRVYERIMG